jgi:hypothetical protein
VDVIHLFQHFESLYPVGAKAFVGQSVVCSNSHPGTGSTASVNLQSGVTPRFTQSVFNTSLADLPARPHLQVLRAMSTAQEGVSLSAHEYHESDPFVKYILLLI